MVSTLYSQYLDAVKYRNEQGAQNPLADAFGNSFRAGSGSAFTQAITMGAEKRKAMAEYAQKLMTDNNLVAFKVQDGKSTPLSGNDYLEIAAAAFDGSPIPDYIKIQRNPLADEELKASIRYKNAAADLAGGKAGATGAPKPPTPQENIRKRQALSNLMRSATMDKKGNMMPIRTQYEALQSVLDLGVDPNDADIAGVLARYPTREQVMGQVRPNIWQQATGALPWMPSGKEQAYNGQDVIELVNSMMRRNAGAAPSAPVAPVAPAAAPVGPAAPRVPASQYRMGQVIDTPRGPVQVVGFDTDGQPLIQPLNQ